MGCTQSDPSVAKRVPLFQERHIALETVTNSFCERSLADMANSLPTVSILLSPAPRKRPEALYEPLPPSILLMGPLLSAYSLPSFSGVHGPPSGWFSCGNTRQLMLLPRATEKQMALAERQTPPTVQPFHQIKFAFARAPKKANELFKK